MTQDTYRDFVMDQLATLGAELECHKMFGGYGLYLGPTFFGILFGGRLYFRTDDSTRGDYLSRGVEPFRPNARQTLSDYYEVPVEIVEDQESLVRWARRAAQAKG